MTAQAATGPSSTIDGGSLKLNGADGCRSYRLTGDFQESCHSLAAIQAALINGSSRTGSGSFVGLFIHTSAG